MIMFIDGVLIMKLAQCYSFLKYTESKLMGLYDKVADCLEGLTF